LQEKKAIPAADLMPFSRAVFSKKFDLTVRVKDVLDKQCVENYVAAFVASLGGIANPFANISSEMLSKMSRLGKVLDRMNSPYEHERANAFRILSGHLKDMSEVDIDTVKAVHGALDAGADLDAKAQVSIEKSQSCFGESGWMRTRDWFNKLTTEICRAFGLKTGYCSVGKVCHNGKAILGTLSAALTAGVIIAKIADNALTLAKREYFHLSDAYQKQKVNAFCVGFIEEMTTQFRAGENGMSEGAMRMGDFADMCEASFGWRSFDPVTPTKSNRSLSAADEGRSSAEKRKRDSDYEGAVNVFERQKVRALAFY